MWKSYLKKKFGTENVVSLEDDLKQQLMGVGDFLVDNRLRIEVKTRKEWVYRHYSNEVALETNANVEWNRKGSAFMECRADLFGYGFLVNNNTTLMDPRLYVVDPLQLWFEENHHRYREQKSRMNRTNTEGCFYHSTFKSIPKQHISRFRFELLDELFR